MNMKKTVSLLLAFLMILGIMPVGIFAVGAEMQDGLTEATAYQVTTLQELSEKLRDPSAIYIDVVNEINEEFTSAENTNGILEIVGTKVLNLYQPVSVTSAGAGQVRSLFHLDSATDNLTVKGGANIFYYSNHTVDGAVVWARNGKFTLESGNLYGRVKSGVAASCHAVLNSGGNVLLQVGELNGYTASRNGQDVWGVVYLEGGTTVLGGTPFGLTVNGSYNESGSFTCKLAGISVYGNATQSVTLKENVTVNKIKDFSIAISTLSTQKVSSIVGAGCSMYQKSGKQMIGTNTTSIAESVRVIKPVTFASFHVEGYRAGSAIDADGKVAGLTVTAPDVIKIGGAYIGTSNDEDNYLKDTILTANTDYWLIVEFSAAGSYDPSLLNAELISLDGVTPVAKEYEAFPAFDLYYAKFKLPQLKATAVDTFSFDLTGYERGAKAGDVQIESSSGIIIDTTITGISDDPEADSLLSGSWALEIGENYYFQVVFSAAAGYDISDLSAEKVHLNGVTPTSITANYTSGVGTIIFGLPKIPREPITSIDLTINGYGSGKTPADVEITEAAAKVTVDDVVFSTDEAGTSEITSSTQFYNNMDIWVSFTVFAAEDKSVAALTKELISISGVRAEIISAEYNSSYDYLDVKLKLAQIPTPPSIDIDVSGHALGAPITGVAAVLGALADDIEIQSVGIYSDASCDSSYELTEGNFAGDTDYWMEIVVVSDLPMDMITDSIVQINGVTYTDIEVDYDARYDYLSIRLQLEQIAGTKLEFELGGYVQDGAVSGVAVTEKDGTDKITVNEVTLYTSLEDAKNYENIVEGNILANTDYWMAINIYATDEFDISAVLASAITLTGVSGAEVEGIYYDSQLDLWDVIVVLPRFVDESTTLEFDIDGYVQDGAVSGVAVTEKDGTDKITVNEVTLYTSLEDAKNYENIVEGNILANTDYWMAINIYATDEFDISAVLATAITLTGIGGAEVEGIYYDEYYDLWDVIIKLPRFVDDSKLLEFALGGYLQDGDVENVTAEEASDEEKITVHITNLFGSLEDAKNYQNEITSGQILANKDYWLVITVFATEDSNTFDLSAITKELISTSGIDGAIVEGIYQDATYNDLWDVIIKLPKFYVEGFGYSVSGTVTSFGDGEEDVTIELFKEGEAEAAYRVTVVGTVESAAAFMIEGVEAGTYILKVSKSKHATREYVIEVVDADVEQMCKIHLYGDVTGDGSIDSSDAMQILRFAASKTSLLAGVDEAENAYLFNVANIVTTDGDQLNSSDAMQIFRYSAEKASALDSIA